MKLSPSEEHRKQYLETDNRLARWNHLRYRCSLPQLSIEQAVKLLANPDLWEDLKEYLDQ